LLLKGETSPRMFHLIVDRLAQALPRARQVTIPKASHSMSSGNPQAYNQAVMEFLMQ
jgi:pimeloyl-ACP methyl ester carboxylesterase